MIVYQSHLGGVYLEDEPLDFEDLYCETCGDSDFEIGNANTWEEFLELLTETDEDEGHWLPYDMEYLEQFKCYFEEE